MKLHQSSAGTSSATMDVLLCPGVKVLAPRKLTKEQLSGKDDEVMGNGFGANVQLLDTDIDHLQEIFPGEPAQLLKEMLKDAIPPEAWLPSYPDVNIVEEKLREMWRQRRLRAIRRARSGSRTGSAASLWRETNAITGAGGSSGEADRYSTAGSERSRARAASATAGGRTSRTGSLLHRIAEDDEEDEEDDDEWGSDDDEDEGEDEEEGGDEEEDALEEEESVPSGSDLGGDYDDDEEEGGEDGSSAAAPTYPRPGICRIAHARYDRTAPPPSDYHSEGEEDEDDLPAVDVDMPVLLTAHGAEKEFVQGAKGWWAEWERREEQKQEEARQKAEEEEEGGGGRSSRASRGSKQPLQRSPQAAPVRPSARRAGGTGTGGGDTAAGSAWPTAGSSGSTRASTKAAARIATAPKRKAAEISPPAKRAFRGMASEDEEEEPDSEEEEEDGERVGKKRAKASSGYALSKKHSKRRHGYRDDEEEEEEDSGEEEDEYQGTGRRGKTGKPASSSAHGNAAKQARKGRHVPHWRRLLEAGGTYVSDEEGADASGRGSGGPWRGSAGAGGRHTAGTEGVGGKAAAHRASAASGLGKSSVLMGLRVKTSPPSHGGRRAHANPHHPYHHHVSDGSAFRSISGAGGTGKYKTR